MKGEKKGEMRTRVEEEIVRSEVLVRRNEDEEKDRKRMWGEGEDKVAVMREERSRTKTFRDG